MPTLRLLSTMRSLGLLLGLVLVGPGTGVTPVLAQEREVTRLHAELGRLDEEKEKATRRRDRKAAARIEREMKQVLSDLRRARKAEREASEASGTASAGDPAPTTASAPGESEPIQPGSTGAPLPLVSRIRWEREQAARNQGSIGPRPTPARVPDAPAGVPAASGSMASKAAGMGLLPRQRALIQEMDAKVAELRTNLVDAEKAFFAMSPEEQNMMRPVFEMMQAQGKQAIVDAETQREEAIRGVEDAEATLDESQRIRERSERLLRGTAP